MSDNMLRKILIYRLILFKPDDFIPDDMLEAGVVFLPDTTVFVESSFKTMIVFLSFPELPVIDVTQLQLTRHNPAQDMTQNGTETTEDAFALPRLSWRVKEI